jgi:hypothetical protein
METIVKISHSKEGKQLLNYIKSLEFVKVLGKSNDFVDVKALKQKVKTAEKSASLSFEEAVSKSEKWKSRYK